MAASEFQRTLMSNLSRQGMSVAGLARQTGYSPSLLDNLIAGKTRQIPVDFFIRVGDTLKLTMEEKDALLRSWAFGIENPLPLFPSTQSSLSLLSSPSSTKCP